MSKKAAEALAKALIFVEKMQALKDEWWLADGQRARTHCDISKQMHDLRVARSAFAGPLRFGQEDVASGSSPADGSHGV
jgi:hypothetical protein